MGVRYECDNCGNEPEIQANHPSLSRCAGCHITFYCGRDCQKEDWPDHKTKCKDPKWRKVNAALKEEKNAVAQKWLDEKREWADAIVETTGETRAVWHDRVEAQPPFDATSAAFYKRARLRKKKPIAYRQPVVPLDQVLRFGDKDPLDVAKLVKGISQLELSRLDDSDAEKIANAPLEFRSGLRILIAGAPSGNSSRATTESGVQITDAGVKKLCEACSNLEVVKLMKVRNLGQRAFPGIVLNCPNIEAITIRALKGRGRSIAAVDFLDDLADTEYRTKLRYLEFRNIPGEHDGTLGFLTKARPALEVVSEPVGEPAVLIRDWHSIPLSRIPPQAAEAGDSDWEDEESDEEGKREKRKQNARDITCFGRQMSMAEALGRPLNEFEKEQISYELLTEESTDEDGISDGEYRTIMNMMAKLDTFEDSDDDH
ncbi:hypothetical protein GGR56DRAFT_616637 [Xylariaceae sp. FL0804]|nr:hypothetical protein GGR56DRAFT_616637 [Xylariaceae sp. FL0804]